MNLGAQRWMSLAGAETEGAHGVEPRMRGEIRLGGRWRPLSAEQILVPGRGFVWKARAQMGPLRISGFDVCYEGEGVMDWRVWGVLPVIRAQGRDVSRSARGRLAIESVFVPAFLEKVKREESPGVWVFEEQGETVRLRRSEGRLTEAWMMRWGNPSGTWRAEPFGVQILAVRDFEGVSLPSEVRAGWYWGTDRWVQGEFFRAEITDARLW